MVSMSRLSPLRRSSRRGFTLVELLVTAAVLMVASAVSFPTVVRFYESQKLRHAAIELQSQLLRGRSMAQRLQTNCSLSLSSGGVVQVSGNDSASTNACASANLAPLNLSTEVDVRNLCVSRADGGPANCIAPEDITFLPLGVMAGAPRTIYLSSPRADSEFCVGLNLTLVRVGFRNANSGACTYTGS